MSVLIPNVLHTVTLIRADVATCTKINMTFWKGDSPRLYLWNIAKTLMPSHGMQDECIVMQIGCICRRDTHMEY